MKPRILIIDDNQDVQEDFRKLLSPPTADAALADLERSMFGETAETTASDYELDFASQGQEAFVKVKLAIASGRPYGMAFVDIRMPPGWDGVETIREIRRVDPVMNFVVCTAFSDYSPETAGQKVGLNDGLLFIYKPFDADSVRQLAKRLSAPHRVSKAG